MQRTLHGFFICAKDNECIHEMKRRKQSLSLLRIMGKIYLKNIRLYAFHGCMDEEEKIGSDYVVNLVVKTDLSLLQKQIIWQILWIM